MVVVGHKQQSLRWHLTNAKMASIDDGAGLDIELSSNNAGLSVFPQMGIFSLCYNGI